MSGLTLPRDVGVSEREATARENAWTTIDRVNARMAARGLDTNDEPDVECPVVTAELLLTTDIAKYTNLYAAQLRWYNYVVVLVGDVRSMLLEIDNAMDDIASARRIAFREQNKTLSKPERMSVTEMDDSIQQDPYYRPLKLQRQILEQERIKLDARADTLERNLKTVSRQIENRKTESQGGNREQNMPGHASGRWERRLEGARSAFVPRQGPEGTEG